MQAADVGHVGRCRDMLDPVWSDCDCCSVQTVNEWYWATAFPSAVLLKVVPSSWHPTSHLTKATNAIIVQGENVHPGKWLLHVVAIETVCSRAMPIHWFVCLPFKIGRTEKKAQELFMLWTIRIERGNGTAMPLVQQVQRYTNQYNSV